MCVHVSHYIREEEEKDDTNDGRYYNLEANQMANLHPV